MKRDVLMVCYYIQIKGNSAVFYTHRDKPKQTFPDHQNHFPLLLVEGIDTAQGSSCINHSCSNEAVRRCLELDESL
jgi:hypothetical protein